MDGGLSTDIGCRENEDCTVLGLSGPCGSGNGFCEDKPTQTCRRDIDCIDAGFVGPCLDANICDQLIFPWLETVHGNVFSEKKILAPVAPPTDRFNATYCITAKGSIMNFSSELGGDCGASADANTDITRPKPSNAYSTVLGSLDIAGLLAGKYGTVVNSTPATFNDDFSTIQPLAGRVIAVNVTAPATELVVSYQQILNAALNNRGNGTVVVNGGNLRIAGNLVYQNTPVDRLSNLASLGWIVLPRPDGTLGNVFVDGSVREIVGSFFVAGEEGFDTVAPPLDVSEIPFKLNGLVIARKFVLERLFRSPDYGSERFIYDGRAVANPPPGFADITKSMPIITDTP
jgi:hypothetical protein